MASNNTSSSPAQKPIVRHSLYDLFLGTEDASPTLWYLQNAENLPAKVRQLLQDMEPLQPSAGGPARRGFAINSSAGEQFIHITDAAWGPHPDLVRDLNDEKDIVRELRLHLEVSSPDGRREPLVLTIPEVPFLTPWGTYVHGANQILITNRLAQKPGIFPVNLTELGQKIDANNGILFHTPFASVMQTKDNLVAITRTLITHSQADDYMNRPVTIPRIAWEEFDRALKLAAFKSRAIPLESFPNLSKAFHSAMKLKVPSSQFFTNWIRDLAAAKVPPGSWERRWARLGAPAMAGHRFWTIDASREADRALGALPKREFIPFESIARMNVQTGADLLAAMIAQKTAWVLESHRWNPRYENLPADTYIRQRWNNHKRWNMLGDLITATHSGPEDPTSTLANEKTPLETPTSVNKFHSSGHVFGSPDGTSDVQRNFDIKSALCFLSPITQENENVGAAEHPLGRTTVDPKTGELQAPFVVPASYDPTTGKPVGQVAVRLNSEGLEQLEADLAKAGLGLYLGRPQDIPEGTKFVTLTRKGESYERVPKADIPAYLDISPKDALPQQLRGTPGIETLGPDRLPMSEAFLVGASSCNGSGPSQAYDPVSAAACEETLNSGKSAKSPVDGTILDLVRDGRYGSVHIATSDGTVHEIEYPVDLTNPFSNPVGIACTKRPGDSIKKGEYLLVPNQSCVTNSLGTGTPGVYPYVTVPTASFSIGEEDQYGVSRATAASRIFSIIQQKNTASIDGSAGKIQVAVAQPGTLIYPGQILGWQEKRQADGTARWSEIRAGNDDRGILANVFVVRDSKGAGGSVEFIPEATIAPNLHSQTAELLATIRADFDPISKGWRPEVEAFWESQGQDCREDTESAYYSLRDAGRTLVRQINLEDLRQGFGNEAHDQLCQDLVLHAGSISFGAPSNDRPRTSLETALHYTQDLVRTMVERASTPVRTHGLPSSVKRIVFSYIKPLDLMDGDKFAAHGSKGSLKLHHPQELPMSVVDGRLAFTAVARTELGPIARTALSDMYPSDKKSASSRDSVFWAGPRGLITAPVSYGLTGFLRQGTSNPGTAADSRGIPGRDGYTTEGDPKNGRKANVADVLMAPASPARENTMAGDRSPHSLRHSMPELRTHRPTPAVHEMTVS